MSNIEYKNIAFNAEAVAGKTQAQFIKSVRLNKAGQKTSNGLICDQHPNLTDDDLKAVHAECVAAVKVSKQEPGVQEEPPQPEQQEQTT